MKKLFLFTMFVVALAFGAAAAQAGVKVEICHIPPGNPDNFHTITISERALSAHLAHGDLGEPCSAVCAILCDDNDACTIDDTGDCEVMGCPVVPELVDCDDQNECTEDSCDPSSGCTNEPLPGAACDDAAICTFPDTCNAAGQCVGEPIADCCLSSADCSQNPCDEAVCDTETNRCLETPVECPAPDLCTISACAPDSGQCVNSAVTCPTGETCNPATGQCVQTNPAACQADNALPFETGNESCKAILNAGNSSGDGLYTIAPAGGTGFEVYCDMTTGGGGWTLVAHAPNAQLATGSLLTAQIGYDPIARNGPGHIDASVLIKYSREVAYAWDGIAGGSISPPPIGNLSSYNASAAGNISSPATQNLFLSPDTGGRPCATASQQTYWCEENLQCLAGVCNLPDNIQAPVNFQDACYGRAFGMALSNGNPQCDWHIDSQGFRAIYMQHTPGLNCYGVVQNPGGSSNWLKPEHLHMWFR